MRPHSTVPKVVSAAKLLAEKNARKPSPATALRIATERMSTRGIALRLTDGMVVIAKSPVTAFTLPDALTPG